MIFDAIGKVLGLGMCTHEYIVFVTDVHFHKRSATLVLFGESVVCMRQYNIEGAMNSKKNRDSM